jgi:hypothetical protein
VVQSNETTVSKALIKGLNVFDFDSDIVAYMVASASEPIKANMLRLALDFIKYMAIEFDSGVVGNTDDHYRNLIKARKLQDTIDEF